MTELSGMELRMALCEWLYPDKRVELKPGQVWLLDKEGWQSATFAPALESSPGVFWPEFDKWFQQRRRLGLIRYVFGDDELGIWFKIAVPGFEGRAEGATLTEAGCRAWLKAIQALKEK